MRRCSATAGRSSWSLVGHQTALTSTATPTAAPPVHSLSWILKGFIEACANGSKEHIEPFLHHNFVFDQTPSVGFPKGVQKFKYDFLKLHIESRSAFSSRRVEVLRMVEQHHTVVVETRSVQVAAMDLGQLAKKGQSLTQCATLWVDFDPQTKMLLRIRAFDTFYPAEDV